MIEKQMRGPGVAGGLWVALLASAADGTTRTPVSPAVLQPRSTAAPIEKRVRWFMSSPTKMVGSRFLQENSDIVDGFYYCCFALCAPAQSPSPHPTPPW